MVKTILKYFITHVVIILCFAKTADLLNGTFDYSAYFDKRSNFIHGIHRSLKSLSSSTKENLGYTYTDMAIITSRIRHKRSPGNSETDDLIYTFKAFGEDYKLNLQRNHSILSSELTIVKRDGNNVELIKDYSRFKDCLYSGSVTSHKDAFAILDVCNGLKGFMKTQNYHYEIHPTLNKTQTKHFVITKRALTEKAYTFEKEHEETNKAKKRTVRDSSNAKSQVLNIEVACFVDSKLYFNLKEVFPEFSDEDIIRYIMTIINGVQLIYNDASFIGIPIHLVLVRIEILKNQPNDLKTSEDAGVYLGNFKSFQNHLNPLDDINNPVHWDHALLLTGLDIEQANSFSVAGYAPVEGMCDPMDSTTIVEGDTFASVYIIAHEMGHSCGMKHDGEGNACDPDKYLMSANGGAGKVTWSACSRAVMNEFLGKTQSNCIKDLSDPDPRLDHAADSRMPGQRFGLDMQCQLSRGRGATHKKDQTPTEICRLVWCFNGTTYASSHPALEGTFCDNGKWCSSGLCVSWGREIPHIVNGGWGPWSEYGACTSGCLIGSTGISLSERKCDNPSPENGGLDCDGPRRKPKTCDDLELCPTKKVKSLQAYMDGICKLKKEKNPKLTGAAYLEPYGCMNWCIGIEGTILTWQEPYPDGTDCSNGNKTDPAYCVKGKCMKFGCDIQDPENINQNHCPAPEIGKWSQWQSDGLCRTECIGDKKRHGVTVFTRQCNPSTPGIYNCLGIDHKLELCDAYAVCSTRTMMTKEQYIHNICTQRAKTNASLTGEGIHKADDCKIWCNTRNGLIISGYDYLPLGTNCKNDGSKSAICVNDQCLINNCKGELTIDGKPEICDSKAGSNSLLDLLFGILGVASTKMQYSWRIFKSACSRTCNGGTRSITTRCYLENTGYVKDSYCEGTKLQTSTETCNLSPCIGSNSKSQRSNFIYGDFVWRTSIWSPCSKMCGNGQQIRSVHCVERILPKSIMFIVQDSACSSPRPNDSQDCTGIICYRNQGDPPEFEFSLFRRILPHLPLIQHNDRNLEGH